MIQFDVLGLPVPKGSLKAFTPKGWTRPVLTSTSVGLKDWAAVVRHQAQGVAPGTLYPEGVAVWLAFRLPRPKALPKAKLTPHTKKPDLDKLIRAVLDALSGVLFTDDSQVVQLTCSKRYAAVEEAPGVAVTLESSSGPARLSGLEPSAVPASGGRSCAPLPPSGASSAAPPAPPAPSRTRRLARPADPLTAAVLAEALAIAEWS